VSKLSRNEQTKLSATYLNGVAIALFAVGGLAPSVSLVSGGTQQVWPIAVLVLGCIGISICLHWVARWILKELVE